MSKKDRFPTVVFLIDHPSRDLFFSCLIGGQLSFPYRIDFQDGYFTPQGPNFFARVKKEDKYIISPSYNVSRTPNLKLRKKYTSAKLILLHSEQLLAPVALSEKFNIPTFNEYNNDVDLHLVWNQSFKNILLEYGVPEKKIFVVGNPKFDILRLMKGDSLPINSGRLLFITSFNPADFDDSEWADYCKEYFLVGNESLNQTYKKIRSNFAEGIRRIEDYCRRNNKKIVIRKHPGESNNFYSNLISDVVELSKDDQLHDDLKKSELVFTFTSSVVFESFVLGVPTYAIKWGELDSDLMQTPSQDYSWHSISQLREIIECPENFKQAITEELFQEYFGSSEQFSTSEIARILNSFIRSSSYKNFKKNNFLFFYGYGLKFIFKFIFNYLAVFGPKFIFSYFTKKINSSYSNWLRNDHYTTQDEIQKNQNLSYHLIQEIKSKEL